jgi:hypothetical protein
VLLRHASYANSVKQTRHGYFGIIIPLYFNRLTKLSSGIIFAFTLSEGELIMKKEIFFGLLWGLALGLLTVVLLFSTAKPAVLPDDNGGNLEILISGDSVRVELDKDGTVKSVTVRGDSLERTSTGVKIENDILIQDGKIFVDGVELSQQQLQRLSISEDRASSESWQGPHGVHRRINRRRLATVYGNSDEDLVKFNDIVVDSTSAIRGDVVSVSGDITVFGRVTGDVVSVFGNIYLKNGAAIGGDVTAPMGRVEREPNVTLRGETIGRQKAKHGSVEFGMSARFNRVEGFTLLPGLDFADNKGRLPKLNINGAYAFTLKRWEYDFGVSHQFGKEIMPYFDIHIFQAALSPDEWRFSEVENTVAGLFFKEDFWDFYWARGINGEAGVYLTDDFKVGALYTAERISTLRRTAKKAIFGGDKRFRENWSTVASDSADILGLNGDLNEAGLKLGYDTRSDKTKSFQSGVSAGLEWRKTVDASSFDYQLMTAEAQGCLPIASNQLVLLSVRGGYSNDNLPLFRRFFLGGIGSLRGYDFKEFQGNRYILVSGDYFWRFFRSDFGAGAFFDSGKAARSGHEFRSGGLKTDVGISFLIEDAFRLDLAQRLDDLNRHPVVSGRLEMPF